MIKYLRRWRKDRNITKPNYEVFVANVIEELLEPLYTKEDIPKIQKDIMGTYFKDFTGIKENQVLDTIDDITVFSINETETMGYDKNKTMTETIKEISSREQNPNQKEIWDKWGADGKWEKNKNQDPSTLYTADYSKCKFQKEDTHISSMLDDVIKWYRYN